MLRIISSHSRGDFNKTGRREFLQVGSLGLSGLTLPGLLSARANAASTGQVVKETSVVMLFLTGGPSQIETFDPKMTAPAEYRSVTGEVATTIPGVTLGGTFERLSRWTHRMALVRSFTHSVSDHTLAVEQVMRGGNPIHQAGMGAIASKLFDTSRRDRGIPTHLYLGSSEVDTQFDKERQRLLAAAGPGTLGGSHAPFAIGGDRSLEHDLQLQISRIRLDDRRSLLAAIDGLNRQIDARDTKRGIDQFERQAFELILGTSRTAFDLSREDARIVKRYDTSSFETGIRKNRPSTLGHQLLLARRLCEAGCGFVTIHNPGWDMHGGDTQLNMPVGMEKLGRPVDHAVSAFLEDVEQRQLSDRILLIITGEFGRTPLVRANGGRDHWPNLSTLAFAGGGLRMGQVIGRSTSRAEEPLSDPVSLDGLFATVMHVLFDLASLRRQPDLGRDMASLLDRNRPIEQLI